MNEPAFLSLEIVERLHAKSIARFGGLVELGAPGLLESALASAQNAYYYGNGDLFDIAAAYAFHIAEAQAFLDGNKRTAVAAADVFLESNDVVLNIDEDILYNAMIDIANKRLTKAGLAAILRSQAVSS